MALEMKEECNSCSFVNVELLDELDELPVIPEENTHVSLCCIKQFLTWHVIKAFSVSETNK